MIKPLRASKSSERVPNFRCWSQACDMPRPPASFRVQDSGSFVPLQQSRVEHILGSAIKPCGEVTHDAVMQCSGEN